MSSGSSNNQVVEQFFSEIRNAEAVVRIAGRTYTEIPELIHLMNLLETQLTQIENVGMALADAPLVKNTERLRQPMNKEHKQ